MAISQAQRDRILLALGNVVVASVQVEWSAGRTYVTLSRFDTAPSDPLGASWSRVYGRCRKLVDALPAGPVIDQVSSLLNRADELYEQRNRAVHGLWLLGVHAEARPPFDESQISAGPATYAVNFRRQGNETVRWDAQQLETLAADLLTVAVDLAAQVIPLWTELQ